jgi:uncharacterized repeat protein (TIGR03806 family)
MLGKISIGILLSVLFLASCKNDDNYSPLAPDARNDFIEILQNRTVEIYVLNNDLDIPEAGTFAVTASENATITIEDPNNTQNNPSDDYIQYTPTPNFTGEDIFEYTICDASQTSCASAIVTVSVQNASPVRYVPSELPYEKLSDYKFFTGNMSNLEPAFGVVPFEPISALFSDYAKKKRFIWMPNNATGRYVSDHEVLDFPEGTILIKNFYYTNVLPDNSQRIIETRLMIMKDGKWMFANYIWNTAQTEAYFDLSGGPTQLSWLQNGVKRTVEYRIPAESQCFTCHKSLVDNTPIGLKPQNLNGDYPYAEGVMNQLTKLVEMGYLDASIPATIETVVNWEDTSQSLDLRVRSYFDINCAHCHSDVKHCDYRPMRFAFNESADPVNLGVCVDPDTSIPPYTKIVNPGDKETSVLFFRFSTTLEQYRMPLFGRTLVHDEALALIEEWINSLTENCD